MDYMKIITKRRSVYELSANLPISHEECIALIENILEASPTAFNMQSSRAILLFGGEHQKLWDITTSVLKEIVPEDRFAPTQEKMTRFSKGAGTVLFFEDTAIVEEYKQKFPSYAASFDMFAAQDRKSVV